LRFRTFEQVFTLARALLIHVDRRTMATPCCADAKLIRVTGENAGLVDMLRKPLCLALADRRRFYEVSVDSVGRVGEVLVSITGSRGHLPLFFGADELEPGYVSRVVSDTVSRFGL